MDLNQLSRDDLTFLIGRQAIQLHILELQLSAALEEIKRTREVPVEAKPARVEVETEEAKAAVPAGKEKNGR